MSDHPYNVSATRERETRNVTIVLVQGVYDSSVHITSVIRRSLESREQTVLRHANHIHTQGMMRMVYLAKQRSLQNMGL